MSNAILWGRMKEGKTTLAEHLAYQHSNGVVAWDPRNMIDGYKVFTAEELAHAIRDKKWKDSEGETLILHPICYVPESRDLEQDFADFCATVFPPKFTLRRFACIIDEAKQLQSSQKINPELDRAIRQHPRDVLVIQAAHSPQDFHRASKDLMNDVFIFQLQGRSLEAAIEYCDGSPEMREVIAHLPRHHYVHYSFERQEDGAPEFTVCSDPALWYMPLNPEAQEAQASPETRQDSLSMGGKPKPVKDNNYIGWVN